jgi:penicillin-binding protein 2
MTSDSPRIRLRVLAVVCVSLFSVLVARLWYLTVLTGDELQQRAEANTLSRVFEQAPRGRIRDVKGRVLVDNRVVSVLGINREELDAQLPVKTKAAERDALITRIATELSRAGTLTKIADIQLKLADRQYVSSDLVPIAVDISPQLLVYFGERGDEYPGVHVTQETVRSYPYGSRAAHVLGYIGRISDDEYKTREAQNNSKDPAAKPYRRNDDIGKSGIEALFEDDLRGVPGQRVIETDATGRAVRERTDLSTLPQSGHDVWLTIDIDTQSVVEDELQASLEKARLQKPRNATDPEITAPAGASVLLDPENGNVLAMASYPSYDPSDFVGGISATRYAELNDASAFRPLFDRALNGEYAPGSTFKLFTSYAAVTSGVMGTADLPGIDQKIDDSGTYHLANCKQLPGTKCDWTNAKTGAGVPASFKAVDLPRSLAVSSDTYYYHVGAVLHQTAGKRRVIQDVAELFGMGSESGITLPNESKGFIPDEKSRAERHKANPAAFPEGNWYTGDTINVAVGQGDVLSTPLQLVNAYATFANGGTLYAPNLVSKVTTNAGGTVRTFEPRVRRTIALDAVAKDRIMRGLADVTLNADGTAYDAFHSARGGVDFDLDRFPVAGKTGTAEVTGKADTAWFVGVTPVATSERPDTASNTPRVAMVTILEQSGFGGANAAPVVASVLDKVLRNVVPRAVSIPEREACERQAQQQLAAQAAALKAAASTTTVKGTAKTTTMTTTTTATTTTAKGAAPPSGTSASGACGAG